jgi:hypothetical protein
MPLIQFTVTYDDLLNNSNETSNGFTTLPIVSTQTSYNNAATVVRQCNMYGGSYKVRVDGIQIFSGAYNVTTYAQNPQIVNINSSLWHFPGGGSPGLQCSNNYWNNAAPLAGCREFEINTINGQMDLSISISQFGQSVNTNPQAVVQPWNIDKTATWASANFGFIVISLWVEPVDSKAPFGTIKGAFSRHDN